MKIFCTFLLLACAASAQSNQLTRQEKAQGWKLLFDGKTFKGWKDPHKMSPAGDAFAIEDGSLKSKKNPVIREDLFTAKGYADFELQFDWRISPGGNSGLKYRIQDTVWVEEVPGHKFEDDVARAYQNRSGKRPAKGHQYVVGFEYQCIDDQGHPDGRRGGSHGTGALYDTIAPTTNAAKPVGEFNHSKVIVKGSHIEHWLNGVKVVDGDLKSPVVAASAEKRWTKGAKVYELLAKQPVKKCPISLQNHNDEAWFRNLKIRELK